MASPAPAVPDTLAPRGRAASPQAHLVTVVGGAEASPNVFDAAGTHRTALRASEAILARRPLTELLWHAASARTAAAGCGSGCHGRRTSCGSPRGPVIARGAR